MVFWLILCVIMGKQPYNNYAASEAGKIEVVELLLSKGASPFPLSNRWSDLPIAGALEKKEYLIFTRLMNHTLKLLDTYGWQRKYTVIHHLPRALIHCARLGNLDLVKWILDCGVDPNDSVDDHDELAIHLAAANGHLDVVKILVEKGVNPSLGTQRADLYHYQESGNSPLHYSSYYGHVHVSEYLLQCKVNINYKNNYCCTPLYCVLRGYLTYHRQGFVSEASIIFLILNGASLHLPYMYLGGHDINVLSEFDRCYASRRDYVRGLDWSFMPLQIVDLIVSLKKGRPIELAAQCRLVIRAAIKVPVTKQVLKELNLPKPLQKYVLFNYYDDSDDTENSDDTED